MAIRSLGPSSLTNWAWFDRLITYSAELTAVPVVLAGD
jgi:hypothetical protein